jgi:hypothetical protein
VAHVGQHGSLHQAHVAGSEYGNVHVISTFESIS